MNKETNRCASAPECRVLDSFGGRRTPYESPDIRVMMYADVWQRLPGGAELVSHRHAMRHNIASGGKNAAGKEQSLTRPTPQVPNEVRVSGKPNEERE